MCPQTPPSYPQRPPLYDKSTPLCLIRPPLCYKSMPLCFIRPPLCHKSMPLCFIRAPLYHKSTPLCLIRPPLCYKSMPLCYQSTTSCRTSTALYFKRLPLYDTGFPLFCQCACIQNAFTRGNVKNTSARMGRHSASRNVVQECCAFLSVAGWRRHPASRNVEQEGNLHRFAVRLGFQECCAFLSVAGGALRGRAPQRGVPEDRRRRAVGRGGDFPPRLKARTRLLSDAYYRAASKVFPAGKLAASMRKRQAINIPADGMN